MLAAGSGSGDNAGIRSRSPFSRIQNGSCSALYLIVFDIPFYDLDYSGLFIFFSKFSSYVESPVYRSTSIFKTLDVFLEGSAFPNGATPRDEQDINIE